MPLFRKFEMCFRKYVLNPCVVARPDNAHSFKVKEIFTHPSGISLWNRLMEKIVAWSSGTGVNSKKLLFIVGG